VDGVGELTEDAIVIIVIALLDSTGLITVEETVVLTVLELCDGFEDPISGMFFPRRKFIDLTSKRN
jgi:hypothetical protein